MTIATPSRRRDAAWWHNRDADRDRDHAHWHSDINALADSDAAADHHALSTLYA